MENIIHSFWSTPSIKDKTIEHDRNNGGFLTEKHHAMSWALSCLSWKKYYGKITLYTDKKGKEWLIDKLKLPYDDVIVCMDEINNVNPIYYAYSKLYVYSLQDKPFLHVDGDTYIFDKLPIDYKNSDLVCQSYEYNFSFYGKVLKQVCENLNNLPIEIYNYNSENFQAINAGIIGGKDVFFFKQLFLLVNDIFKNNDINSNTIDLERYNVLMEQFYFYMLAKKNNLKIERLINSNISENFKELTQFHLTPCYNSYILLISISKRQYLHFLQLECRLKKEFPETFNHINLVYNNSNTQKNNSFKDNINHFKLTASLIDDEEIENIEDRKDKIENYLNQTLKDKSSYSLFIYDIYQIEDFIYQINTQYSKENTEKEISNNISKLYDKKNVNDLKFKINESKGELIFLNFDYSNYNIIDDLEKIVSEYRNLKQTKPLPYFIFVEDDWSEMYIECKQLVGWNLLYYYLDEESKNISDFINIITKSNFLDYEGNNLEYDITDFLLSNAVYHSYLKIEI